MLGKSALSGVDVFQAFNAAPNPYVVLDRDLVIVALNDAYEAVTMRSRDSIIGSGMFAAFPSDPASGHGKILRMSFARVFAEGVVDHIPLLSYPIAGPDGSMEERYWSATHTPLKGRNGEIAFVLQHTVDVTELHRLRQNSGGSELNVQSDLLRRADAVELDNEHLEVRVEERTLELMEMQETLRQTQKMEAIGTLAGGIAHDFNNLLQVISGSLQLLSRDIKGNDRAETRVRNALAGVARGARLASQLLAFGRRQPLEPMVVNIGRLIYGMDEILRRTLGEAIEVETVISGGLWNTFVDRSNVENALLNLAINARDAMDGNGKLTIEAGNAFLDDAYARSHADIAAGQYVMIAVTDTGSGMSSETTAKVFEPFFTTKPEGKGTGLGLSMVYGFVKQTGGHVKIYSELGVGTSIKIYLPRIKAEEDVIDTAATCPLTGGSEKVLVAEDDEAVRDTAVALLNELGYNVLAAKDAQSALAIIEGGGKIDLLFTDVIMPGSLSSVELARIAAEKRPGIGILFTSGYTENSIVHGGRLNSGINLLSKPYTSEALARKVRQVLENAAKQRSAQPTGAVPPSAGVSLDGSGDTGPSANGREFTGRGVTGPIVLLCEDEALIRITTADMLADMGATVIEAGSGKEALAVIASNPVDVLITDVGLPDISGLELAARFRETEPAAPIIFATGHFELPGSESLGRTTLLIKPYDEVMLKDCLDRMGVQLTAPGKD